jgi:hypothetical protein
MNTEIVPHIDSRPQASLVRKTATVTNLPACVSTRPLMPITLFGRGYRVKAEGFGLRVFHPTTGSYYINLINMTCECRGFRSRRYCKHLTGIRALAEAQRSAYLVEFAAITAQIRRGGLTVLDHAELTREGQEIDDQAWELRALSAMLRQEYILEAA